MTVPATLRMSGNSLALIRYSKKVAMHMVHQVMLQRVRNLAHDRF